MQSQEMLRKVREMFHLQKDAPPPPRWQTLLASFYLGMLLYLAAHLVNLI
jgi:hypothetical protein